MLIAINIIYIICSVVLMILFVFLLKIMRSIYQSNETCHIIAMSNIGVNQKIVESNIKDIRIEIENIKKELKGK